MKRLFFIIFTALAISLSGLTNVVAMEHNDEILLASPDALTEIHQAAQQPAPAPSSSSNSSSSASTSRRPAPEAVQLEAIKKLPVWKRPFTRLALAAKPITESHINQWILDHKELFFQLVGALAVDYMVNGSTTNLWGRVISEPKTVTWPITNGSQLLDTKQPMKFTLPDGHIFDIQKFARESRINNVELASWLTRLGLYGTAAAGTKIASQAAPQNRFVKTAANSSYALLATAAFSELGEKGLSLVFSKALSWAFSKPIAIIMITAVATWCLGNSCYDFYGARHEGIKAWTNAQTAKFMNTTAAKFMKSTYTKLSGSWATFITNHPGAKKFVYGGLGLLATDLLFLKRNITHGLFCSLRYALVGSGMSTCGPVQLLCRVTGPLCRLAVISGCAGLGLLALKLIQNWTVVKAWAKKVKEHPGQTAKAAGKTALDWTRKTAIPATCGYIGSTRAWGYTGGWVTKNAINAISACSNGLSTAKTWSGNQLHSAWDHTGGAVGKKYTATTNDLRSWNNDRKQKAIVAQQAKQAAKQQRDLAAQQLKQQKADAALKLVEEKRQAVEQAKQAVEKSKADKLAAQQQRKETARKLAEDKQKANEDWNAKHPTTWSKVRVLGGLLNDPVAKVPTAVVPKANPAANTPMARLIKTKQHAREPKAHFWSGLFGGKTQHAHTS